MKNDIKMDPDTKHIHSAHEFYLQKQISKSKQTVNSQAVTW